MKKRKKAIEEFCVVSESYSVKLWKEDGVLEVAAKDIGIFCFATLNRTLYVNKLNMCSLKTIPTHK